MTEPPDIEPHGWESFIDELATWNDSANRVQLAHIRASTRSIRQLHPPLALAQMASKRAQDNAAQKITYLVPNARIQGYKNMMRRQQVQYDIISYTDLATATAGCSHPILLLKGDDDYDIEYAFGIFILSMFVSAVQGDREMSIRVVWVSPSAPDFTLENKLRMFCPPGEVFFPMKTFEMPTAERVAFIRDLDWQVYPTDDGGEFLEQVAKSIIHDFGPAKDSSEKQPTYKKNHVVVFWDGVLGNQTSRPAYRPEALHKSLRRMTDPKSVKLVSSISESISRTSTGTGQVIGNTLEPEVMQITDETRHIVICTKKTQPHFDVKTSHVVTELSPLTGPRIRAQAEFAFDNLNVPPEDVTVHAQVSIDDIESMPRCISFEELHLGAFLVMALNMDARLHADQLLDYFIRDCEMLKETVRRLEILGFLLPARNSMVSWKVNKDLVRKAAQLLPCVQFDLQTARFLSCIDRDTPRIRTRAIIDIAALAMRHTASNQIPFIEVTQDLNAPGTMRAQDKQASILKNCADVPPDVVFQGSIWLALGIYRDLFGVLEGDPPSVLADISRCEGLLIVSKRIFFRIRQCAESLETALGMSSSSLEPQTSSRASKLTNDDVDFVQQCMLEAWCGHLLWRLPKHKQRDLLSGRDISAPYRMHGHFMESMKLSAFVLGCRFSVIASYPGRHLLSPTAMIPDHVLGRFLQQRNLTSDQLRTTFPLEDN
ncbi:hypothetical protein K4K52_010161 [Colletotrichum sp. SAR 10_76]|nr:hypothetical protein K4K52_010161 [Colletotrichum sp. SAR 10_76]